MWFMVNSLLLSLILFVFLIFSLKLVKNKEKLYIFECGFNSFMISKSPFSIQFFKILLLFIIFDMEIIVILPLMTSDIIFLEVAYLIVLIMLILIFGLIYEWKEGSLDWLK